MSERKWTLIFDTEKCNGCCNCVIATMDEHVDNEFPGYSGAMPRHAHKWLDIECHERGAFPDVQVSYLAKMCQHCDDPPCAKPVPGAVRKRSDGIVIIDPVRARGAREIVDACPYGAVHWNEEKLLPQHWNFDAHLLDAGWRDTRATQACPTGALQLRKLSDAELAAVRQQEGLSELRPELSSRPRVLYRNLQKIRSSFVSGTVLRTTNGVVDVAAAVDVRLVDANGRSEAETRTDGFGDFRFDGLPSGDPQELRVVISGRQEAVRVPSGRSVHLGELALDPP